VMMECKWTQRQKFNISGVIKRRMIWSAKRFRHFKPLSEHF
jgi:hypothetical protein